MSTDFLDGTRQLFGNYVHLLALKLPPGGLHTLAAGSRHFSLLSGRRLREASIEAVEVGADSAIRELGLESEGAKLPWRSTSAFRKERQNFEGPFGNCLVDRVPKVLPGSRICCPPQCRVYRYTKSLAMAPKLPGPSTSQFPCENFGHGSVLRSDWKPSTIRHGLLKVSKRPL